MTEKMDVQLMELRMIQEYENMLTQLESVSSCNRMERKNEEILLVVRDFFMNPTHAKKEAVLKYVSQTSVSENDYRGRIVAYTDRFNIVLSLIYLYGYQMKFPEIKLYVYRCLVDVSIIEHSFAIFREQLGCDIPQYSPQNLVTNLYIYFLAYTYFRYSDDNKIDSIYTALFYVADSWILSMADDVINSKIILTVIRIIYDLAMTTGYDEIDPYHRYDINDVGIIFSKFAKWIEDYPMVIKSPYPFCTCISVILASMVLRLRNGLDNFPIVKYVSDENLKAAFSNNQVWMHEINKLNDPNEGKIVEEILSEAGVIRYPWQQFWKKDFKYYVGCFSRNTNPEAMSEYGNNGLGYKNDNIATRLAPIFLDGKGYPVLTRVFSYDVAYSRSVVKEELKYVSDLIEKLPMHNNLKTMLFSMFVARIKYSVKDKKWEHEQERRYVIEMWDEPEFLDAVFEDGFIKVDTSLYLHPDYLLSCSECFRKRFEKEVMTHIEKDITVPCALCMDCLGINFHRGENTCRQCGSTNLKLFEGINPFPDTAL